MKVYASPERQVTKLMAKLKLPSVRTAENYKQIYTGLARFANENYQRNLNQSLRDEKIIAAFLESRATEISQKYLNTTRSALNTASHLTIEKVESTYTASRYLSQESRAYSPEHVAIIVSHQAPHNALATEIVSAAGLRAHELFTLLPTAERPPTTERDFRPDLFLGREGERYTVVGKGGLAREVLIPSELAGRLEQARLETPKTLTDRTVRYQQNYKIGAGQSWSKSFSEASKWQLGYSNGGHGLRHGYAQDRVLELEKERLFERDVREIVSQELGHFRPDVTLVYLH